MTDVFADCLVTNSRMAARAITRRYDGYLRPVGLTSTQLSLLGALRGLAGATVSEVAEQRGFERTTLTRNLDRLQNMGLVASKAAARGNGRIPGLTAEGEALLDRLLPLWRQAQADMRAELSPQRFAESIGALKRLQTI